MGRKRKPQWFAQQPPPTKVWADHELCIVHADDANQCTMSDDVYTKWARGGHGKGHVIKGGCKGGGKGGGNGDGDGDGNGGGGGKGGGNGNRGKGKLRKGNYMPKAGDMLYFHPSKRHAFYDAFPSGNQINVDDLEINLDHPIYVVETSSATLDTEHTWWGSPKMDYVAVSFVTVSGQVVWTNLSRNGTLWMRIP